MKRMTKGRGDDLCKSGAQRADPIGGAVGLHSQIDVVGTGDVAEFMNHGTLLRHQQQQQKAQGFERLSHLYWYRRLSLTGPNNAIRILDHVQYLCQNYDGKHPRVIVRAFGPSGIFVG